MKKNQIPQNGQHDHAEHGHVPDGHRDEPTLDCGNSGQNPPMASCCDLANGFKRSAAPGGESAQTRRPSDPPNGLLLRVPAMDCTVEENQIRAELERLPNVRELRFDLHARTVHVQAPETSWPDIQTRLKSLGFESERLKTSVSEEDIQRTQRRELARHVAALIVAFVAELVHLLFPDQKLWLWVGMAIAAIAIGLAGLDVLRKGFLALRRANLNINALMTVAVIGAFLIGDWPEAAMVMALYGIAELIEARAVNRARDAISGLLDLAPTQALVRHGDGQWRMQAVSEVSMGAVVRVQPGERFAFDAKVLSGVSSADQSAITGESAPVEKSVGDVVYAGTVNQFGELIIEVTTAASNTVLSQIIEAVEQAQNARAPIQKFVDRFAAIYTPAVFVMAVLVALTGPLLMGASWLDSVYKGLVLLVIACPCALVISTPVTLVSGLTAATRMGVLVKGGVFIEQARRLKVLALDKTGTLTKGQPELLSASPWQAAEFTQKPALSLQTLAVALCRRSNHPVSMAIEQGLLASSEDRDRLERQANDLDFSDVTVLPGKGFEASLEGQTYRLGNRRWMSELGLSTRPLEDFMEQHEQQGHTVSLLANDQAVLMVFAVADTLRETSRAAVDALQAMGVQVIMLTGDNVRTAKAMAAQVGIDTVYAELLPQEKLKRVQELASAQGQSVGMVGDGINDAPALVQADIGFAMGQSGTDIATNSADVIIMNDDLGRIPRLIRLSERVYGILWQNITLALGIKAVFLGLALMDQATMWMAVFADMGASLLVVMNGLRIVAKDKTT